jgi:hypothetical protein
MKNSLIYKRMCFARANGFYRGEKISKNIQSYLKEIWQITQLALPFLFAAALSDSSYPCL